MMMIEIGGGEGYIYQMLFPLLFNSLYLEGKVKLDQMATVSEKICQNFQSDILLELDGLASLAK